MKAALTLLVFVSAILSTPIVELRIDERFGQERSNEPVTSGVPLPNGYLTDISSLALTDSNGNKVDCEFRKVSEWHNNNSIKWVHLDFQASTPESGSVKFTLVNDPSKHTVSSSYISATDNGDAIDVNTGKIRFSVKKKNYNIIDQAIIGSDTVIAPHNRGIVIRLGSTYYLSSNDTTSNTVIERNGDMSVCIKSEGYLRTESAVTCSLYFIARTYAFNNSPVIKYVLSLELHKNKLEDSLIVRSLYIDLPTRMNGATVNLGAPSADKSAQLGSTDSAWVLASNLFNIGATESPKVFYTFGGVFSGFGHAMNSETFFHDKTLGWASLSNGTKGFAMCLRDFWQQNPKSMEIQGDGACRIGLYPALRNGDFNNLSWYSGMARTFEMRFALLQNEDVEQTKVLVRGMQCPLIAVAPPSWYCSDTKAFGLHIERDTAKIKKEYQLAFRSANGRFNVAIANHLSQIDAASRSGIVIDAYGFFDWGNHFHYSYDSWDPGKIKWEGNYYGLDHIHFIEFIRSGDYRYFDFFESSTRGHMDTHIGNFGAGRPLSDGACRYCPSYNYIYNETFDGYISGETNHHKNDGMFERYYLCGDERSLDMGMKTAKWAARSYPGGYSSPGQIRGPGAYCWMMLQAYFYTKQTTYLDKVGATIAYHHTRAPSSMAQFSWMGPLFMEGVVQYDMLRPSLTTQDFVKTVAAYSQTNMGPRWALTCGYGYSITQDVVYLDVLKQHITINPSASNPYKDFAQEYRNTSMGLYYLSHNPILISTEKRTEAASEFGDRIDCFPNPFNPSVSITILSNEIGNNSRMEIVNNSGQIIRTFNPAKEGDKGVRTFNINWDGKDNFGNATPSGIYIMRYASSKGVITKKLTLCK